MSKSMVFVHQLVIIFSSREVWDSFPYVRPCWNSQYQFWKTIFQVGFSWGFNFVNIWNLSENTHKIFENLVQKTYFGLISNPFVRRTWYFTCKKELYPVFDFLRHLIPENDQKFDFFRVTLVKKIIRGKETLKF